MSPVLAALVGVPHLGRHASLILISKRACIIEFDPRQGGTLGQESLDHGRAVTGQLGSKPGHLAAEGLSPHRVVGDRGDEGLLRLVGQVAAIDGDQLPVLVAVEEPPDRQDRGWVPWAARSESSRFCWTRATICRPMSTNSSGFRDVAPLSRWAMSASSIGCTAGWIDFAVFIIFMFFLFLCRLCWW
jgi:hypothetical protein